ncbi:non-SMC mitotic condensation complex subunit 1-domain-containing protein [Mycena floridula]|nr:non-SMC mitotic condensation complex subunit 1-domain-containing protein [Mycena floridula]
MVSSFDLQDQLLALDDDVETFSIDNEHDPTDPDTMVLLESVVERLAESSDAIAQPDVFYVFASLLKHAKSVATPVLTKLLYSITSGLEAEIEATKEDVGTKVRHLYMVHKTSLEIYAFLLYFFALVVVKAPAKEEKGPGPDAPETSQPESLSMNGRPKATKKKKKNEGWMASSEISAALAIVKQRLLYVNNIICLAVRDHNHELTASTILLQQLQSYEHLSDSIAECLASLANDHHYPPLGDGILREITKMTFNPSLEAKSTRAMAKFLLRLGQLAPQSMSKHMNLINRQIDSEACILHRVSVSTLISHQAYLIRNAIVEIIALLIAEFVNADIESDSQESAPQIRGWYQTLLERMRDLSAPVRTKVLSILRNLCETTNGHYPRVQIAQKCVTALHDKSLLVRKGAIMTLVKLIVKHPYEALIPGGELKLEPFQRDYQDVSDQIVALKGAAETDQRTRQVYCPLKINTWLMTSSTEFDMDQDVSSAEPRRRSLSPMPDVPLEAARTYADNRDLLWLGYRQRYLLEAITFIQVIESASSTVCLLLGSSNKTEVLEAIEFFKVASGYKVDAAELGVTNMIHLIWTKDDSASTEETEGVTGICSRVLTCYKALFFDPMPDSNPRTEVSRVARAMMELTHEASLAYLTSLEEMLRILMIEGDVESAVIDKLWDVFSSRKALPKPQRHGAILVLGMLASGDSSVVGPTRVPLMLQHGLGGFAREDLKLARYTCVALQRLNGSVKTVKGSLEDRTLRISMEHSIFKKLQDTLERPCRSREWFALSEQAINTVYALGDKPDIFCSALIKTFTLRVFASKPRQANDPDAMEVDEDSNNGSRRDVCDVFVMSQLLFIVGHVGFKQNVHLDVVEREWKRQKEHEQKGKRNPAGRKQADELDKVTGNVEDEIGDRIAEVRETELLYGSSSLLANFGPMLVKICGSPQMYKSETLRAVATLSFSKFLCISSQFCEENCHLLFKILETSKNASIRSNIAIALGDIAVSFSTIFDENNSELYKRLSDPDVTVKKNTLMVLTHLILNGMVKVKGQLGEMAKCLEDSDARIGDLAKLFFKELSAKDNAIYNNLPDIISHLSSGDRAVDEATFQTTIKYIFSFIEKERQAENTVEKLCQRFQLSDEPRQWRDIAFCLSLLPFKSERALNKLIEGLPFYRDKLHEEGVYARFSEILVKARQNKSENKPDHQLNEFQKILQEYKLQGKADEALTQRVKRKAPKRAKRK